MPICPSSTAILLIYLLRFQIVLSRRLDWRTQQLIWRLFVCRLRDPRPPSLLRHTFFSFHLSFYIFCLESWRMRWCELVLLERMSCFLPKREANLILLWLLQIFSILSLTCTSLSFFFFFSFVLSLLLPFFLFVNVSFFLSLFPSFCHFFFPSLYHLFFLSFFFLSFFFLSFFLYFSLSVSCSGHP